MARDLELSEMSDSRQGMTPRSSENAYQAMLSGGESSRSAANEVMMGFSNSVKKVWRRGVGQLSAVDEAGSSIDGFPQINLPLNTVPFGKGMELDARGLPARIDDLGLCRRERWAVLEKVATFNRAMWGMKPGVREYYQMLNTTVDAFRAADGPAEEDAEEPEFMWIIYLSFGANLLIFAVKVIAAISSGSLVVFASAMDSFLDLLAGSILAASAWIMSKPDREKYPVGKKRMEGLAVILMAAVMLTSYVQVIIAAVQRFASPTPVELDVFTIGLLVTVVFLKGILYYVCQATLKTLTQKAVSLEAQAADHFNDCITNFCSAVGSYLASPLFATGVLGLAGDALLWVDPAIAILFSLYVIGVWAEVARENISDLVGHVAPVLLIQTVTYLTMAHCSEVQGIQRILCYSHGTSYIAEVSIILPRDMPTEQSHNIAAVLQLRIETLADVDRCFVHVHVEAAHHLEHLEDAEA